ncbi:acyl transferase/acyl hydrolase/lysophospholipase [Hypoxylon trugodes]|uniref:acyl transferase/acyl hydrolase/lysophospholipase n=1 Tax=Hypoxylon trugodes TaxID=326681 RepID=UPI0021981025|nr:acyl transferase/acyl hydrolase/lysophospholipase [Hypoxylon trugodes]KAI1384220.1 acyl transferase/acyl hydrolase/lysophospholipase [Hypoxylon trugodes]
MQKSAQDNLDNRDSLAKELLFRNSVFDETIEELDSVLQALPPEHAPTWALRQTILDPPETSQAKKPSRSQPLCTAIQIGLVNILRSWGVHATAVVGHSSGEIAAAYTAALLGKHEAIIVAYIRGFTASQARA